ncbi:MULTISPECIES: hypothetical protein [Lysinibacillus]|uniref:hypothetical protein n=1 Tax=Lysinibacillus TaxID=400634 RepID=UPI00214BC28C|nr:MULTISPECIES: hypothetical protein [Lysinibacillus]UUV26188.1 hypothetical protein NP781_06130 [Lysinibacillus sp. FN11]UYB49061.1 hypothetical protein OCI51_08900 [Lysinibacillus capsici]
MAKKSMIFNLLQNFLLEEEVQTILAEFDFTGTTNKCKVSTLNWRCIILPRINRFKTGWYYMQ